MKMLIPCSVTRLLQVPESKAAQAAIIAFPNHGPAEICALQKTDPVIVKILPFWHWKQHPNHNQRKLLSQPALALLCQ